MGPYLGPGFGIGKNSSELVIQYRGDAACWRMAFQDQDSQ